ncbi:MAG: GAF domain-containing protein [Gemmatimonadaceae bacterium]
MTQRRRIWQLPVAATPPPPELEAELSVVRDLTHTLLRAERADEAFQFALDRTCPAVGASLGSIFVLDGASELMHLAAAHAWPDRWRPWLGEMRVRVGFGPSGEAASERRVIEVPDVFADPGLEDWQEVATELGFRALVALPLATPHAVLGAATFYFATPGTPSPRTRALLRAAADLMAAIADKEALRKRLRHAEAALDDQRSAAPARTEVVGEDGEATTG